jgi:hypothetical protein
MIYRGKALTEENSLKQFILKMAHRMSLAFKGKGIECKIQLNDLRTN